MGGDTRDLCYIEAKQAVQWKHNRLRGKTAMALPAECPQCGGYSMGLKNEKSKSPLFPGGGGLWLQRTTSGAQFECIWAKYSP